MLESFAKQIFDMLVSNLITAFDYFTFKSVLKIKKYSTYLASGLFRCK